MMLKSLGIDASKIMADFEALRDGVVNELKGINTKLATIQRDIEQAKKDKEEFRLWTRTELEKEYRQQQQLLQQQQQQNQQRVPHNQQHPKPTALLNPQER